jgi:dTMP kinase
MALLFAADRSHHVESEIEPWLAQGAIVLSDRYDASSLAYQSATSSDEADALGWICELNRHVRRPDLTLVLDVDADVASARRAERGEPAQLYERMELQQKLAVFYRDLARWMPNDRIVRIDGQGTVEEVEARVYEVVVKLAARVRSEAT